jgi:hypothetical protein
MTFWNIAHAFNVTRHPPKSAPLAVALFLALAAAVPGAFIMYWMWTGPVMPILCLASLASSAVAAQLAWLLRAERHTDYFNLWDAAGAYAFIGFGAGMLSKSEEIVRLFGFSVSAS